MADHHVLAERLRSMLLIVLKAKKEWKVSPNTKAYNTNRDLFCRLTSAIDLVELFLFQDTTEEDITYTLTYLTTLMEDLSVHRIRARQKRHADAFRELDAQFYTLFSQASIELCSLKLYFNKLSEL